MVEIRLYYFIFNIINHNQFKKKMSESDDVPLLLTPKCVFVFKNDGTYFMYHFFDDFGVKFLDC